MAVSFVGGSYGTAVGGDLTLPDVEDVQDRDILLIAAATYWNGSGDLNWPSGFARVDPTADGYTHLAWKRASSESGNYVLPAHNQDVRVAVLMVLRGCVAIGSPFDGIEAGGCNTLAFAPYDWATYTDTVFKNGTFEGTYLLRGEGAPPANAVAGITFENVSLI